MTPPPEDDEYELEALDESVLDLAKQRTEADMARATEALEIDDAHRAMEERQMLDLDDAPLQFRFQVKHLLIGTTALSLLLAMRTLFSLNLFAVLVVVTMFSLMGIHAFLSWKERKRLDEASARRTEVVRRMREQQAALERGESPTMYDEPLEDEADQDSPDEQESPERFRLSFSMRDLLLGVTVACVLMGLGAALPANVSAVVLALIAVSGLVAYGIGFSPPAAVVTVWWMTLALYILLSLAKAVGITGGE